MCGSCISIIMHTASRHLTTTDITSYCFTTCSVDDPDQNPVGSTFLPVGIQGLPIRICSHFKELLFSTKFRYAVQNTENYYTFAMLCYDTDEKGRKCNLAVLLINKRKKISSLCISLGRIRFRTGSALKKESQIRIRIGIKTMHIHNTVQ
jgi:hypothetical protein